MSEQMSVSAAEISVVVQGAISDDAYGSQGVTLTEACLRSIREVLPGSELILSTWEGARLERLSADKIVFSEDPRGLADPFVSDNGGRVDNTNRQIVSTLAGLKEVSRAYAIKMRTDMVLRSAAFLRVYQRCSSKPRKSLLKQRVLINNFTTRNLRRGNLRYPLHFSDHFLFGLTEDLLDIWDIPLLPAEDALYFTTHAFPDRGRQFSTSRLNPEQYIWTSFLRKHVHCQLEHYADLTPENTKLTEDLLASELIVLEDTAIAFHFPKYHTPQERGFEHCRYTHADWLKLYKQNSALATVEASLDFHSSALAGRPYVEVNPKGRVNGWSLDGACPKVSVVIPVYNVESVLPECLDSLVAQTLQEIEVIIVNDASTDGSLKVAHRYADVDSRVRVFNPRNKLGAGAARNYGLDHAIGDFVILVDGDDFLDADMLRRLYTKAVNTKADVAICHFDIYYHDSGVFGEDCAGRFLKGLNFRHAFHPVNYADVLLSPHANYNKLVRRRLLDTFGIRNPTYKFYDDYLFHWEVLISATRIAVIPHVLYHWRCHRRGTITSDWSNQDLAPVGTDLGRSGRSLLAYHTEQGISNTFIPHFALSLVACTLHELGTGRTRPGAESFFREVASLIRDIDRMLPGIRLPHASLAQRFMLSLLLRESFGGFRAASAVFGLVRTGRRVVSRILSAVGM